MEEEEEEDDEEDDGEDDATWARTFNGLPSGLCDASPFCSTTHSPAFFGSKSLLKQCLFCVLKDVTKEVTKLSFSSDD